MLVHSGECLGAQVTTLEQRTDEHFTDIASQLREWAMTYVNERLKDKIDEHNEVRSLKRSPNTEQTSFSKSLRLFYAKKRMYIFDHDLC